MSVWQYRRDGASIISNYWFTVPTEKDIPRGATEVRELKDGDLVPEESFINPNGKRVETRVNLSTLPVNVRDGLPGSVGALRVIMRVVD